jgi:WhiB family redox-sensing transcriptional regulator
VDRVAATELLDLLRPPAWHADAACKEHPELDWVTLPMGSRAKRQRAICAGCLVRAECLQFAMDDEELVGVWGGTTPTQRDIRRAAASA